MWQRLKRWGKALAVAGLVGGGPVPSVAEEVTVQGLRLTLPAGWTQIADEDGLAAWFSGDLQTQTGLSLVLMAAESAEEMVPDATLTPMPPLVLAGGQEVPRMALHQADGQMLAEGQVLLLPAPLADGRRHGLALTAFNTPAATAEPVFAAILATLDLGSAAAPSMPTVAPTAALPSSVEDWAALLPPTLDDGRAPQPAPLAPPGAITAKPASKPALAAPKPAVQAPVQAPVQPPAPPAPAVTVPQPPVVDPDSFAEGEGGYALYTNARFGTFISFPSAYFRPDPPPTNGDGRRFTSVDGAAEFIVFAQMNALGLSEQELLEADKPTVALTEIESEEVTPGAYVLTGLRGGDRVYRRVIVEGPEGLIQVFEIRYPAAREAEFAAVVAYMVGSFGPGFSYDAGWSSPEPLGPIREPARNSAERKAIIEAARGPVADLLGQSPRFQISVLRTDGHWAFLQAEPLASDGSAMDWDATPFAREIRDGFMSTLVMVLLLNDGGGWAVVDLIFGPTDVAWYGWVDSFGLPETLFLAD